MNHVQELIAKNQIQCLVFCSDKSTFLAGADIVGLYSLCDTTCKKASIVYFFSGTRGMQNGTSIIESS